MSQDRESQTHDSRRHNHSILGGWLGSYCYRTRHEMPVRFEATFSRARKGEHGFGGAILDDSPLGEAGVSHGLQTGPNVRFTKTYQDPPAEYETAPVHYLGTLSDDGRLVTGTWEMQLRHNGKIQRTTGRWEARRLWAEAEEAAAGRQSADVEWELPVR
ncbi:MAG: hypothetical protein H7Z41_04475 [Cytophagales bacterium]|nr:hypothetical protein [Armatimonadota bacterium]